MAARRFVAQLMAALAATAAAAPAGETATHRAAAGDYAATLSEKGVVVFHRGVPVTLGSYFTVCTPGYKATLVSSREALRAGSVTRSADGRTLTLEATHGPRGHR